MNRGSLIFVLTVVVSISVILSLVDRSKSSIQAEVVRKKIRVPVYEKQREVKILAVKEKAVQEKDKPKAQSKKNKSGKKRPSASPASPGVKQIKKVAQSKPTKTAPTGKKPDLQPKRRPQKNGLGPASYVLDRTMIHEGRRLIDMNSAVPVVQASYSHIGFEKYLSKMLEMGGRLFLGNVTTREIHSEIYIEERFGRYCFVGLDSGKKNDLEGMALFRPREIAGEALVNKILDCARRFCIEGELACVILLPLDKEAAILGALDRYLKASGYRLSHFHMVWGDYLDSKNRFALRIHKGQLQENGDVVQLDMTLRMQ